MTTISQSRIVYFFSILFLSCSLFNVVYAETSVSIAKTLLDNKIAINKKYSRNLLVFTSTYCTICKAEEKRFESLKQLFQDNKIRLLFVYIDKLPDNYTEKSDFVAIFDKDHVLENTLNPESLPTAFLLDDKLNPIYTKVDGTKYEYFTISPDEDGLFSSKNINKLLKEKAK